MVRHQRQGAQTGSFAFPIADLTRQRQGGLMELTRGVIVAQVEITVCEIAEDERLAVPPTRRAAQVKGLIQHGPRRHVRTLTALHRTEHQHGIDLTAAVGDLPVDGLRLLEVIQRLGETLLIVVAHADLVKRLGNERAGATRLGGA